jgi:L-lactate dehydrogenase complex protein LldE
MAGCLKRSCDDVLISLFITCYNDTLFPDTGKAVIAVLERLGHRVEFRAAQTCCGQMHYNTGYADDAMALLRQFVSVFRDAEIICVPSASCVAMMREHYPRLAERSGDEKLTSAVGQLLPRVFELSELLVDRLHVTDVGARYPHLVTLHTSCHSLRSLHATAQPRMLLQAVQDLRLVDLPDAVECCGFGGTFAVKNAEVSTAMMRDKIGCVLSTSAEVCTATDNSCLMQIEGGLRRRGASVRCVHIAEILATTARQAR